jgi:hypothetical protein
MRDKRWIRTEHGGELTPDFHRKLMEWACRCLEYILPLCGPNPDIRLLKALSVAQAWEKGHAGVKEARQAAVNAHAAAREADDPVITAVARAAGHAAATAHMADHALGPALYAIKAIRLTGRPCGEEEVWQHSQLTPEIRDMVMKMRLRKEKGNFGSQSGTKNSLKPFNIIMQNPD